VFYAGSARYPTGSEGSILLRNERKLIVQNGTTPFMSAEAEPRNKMQKTELNKTAERAKRVQNPRREAERIN
jgi:hypothetical protein